ncbi:MAG: hypothetical protein LIO77_07820 [Rikenellaceae bacterium]|nr:hypothetical protein [Rikenellaceae bacterium]
MMDGIFRIGRLPVRLAPYFRLRHVRGHGIHSPFVYGIIRNALIFGKGFSGDKDILYTFLRTVGVSRRTAMQLQNLHNYCEYGRTVIHYDQRTEIRGIDSGTLRVFAGSCTADTIEALKDKFGGEEGTVVVISPRSRKERAEICKELAHRGDCITIDNRGYILFIYKSGRPPGHYKI